MVLIFKIAIIIGLILIFVHISRKGVYKKYKTIINTIFLAIFLPILFVLFESYLLIGWDVLTGNNPDPGFSINLVNFVSMEGFSNFGDNCQEFLNRFDRSNFPSNYYDIFPYSSLKDDINYCLVYSPFPNSIGKKGFKTFDEITNESVCNNCTKIYIVLDNPKGKIDYFRANICFDENQYVESVGGKYITKIGTNCIKFRTDKLIESESVYDTIYLRYKNPISNSNNFISFFNGDYGWHDINYKISNEKFYTSFQVFVKNCTINKCTNIGKTDMVATPIS